MTTTCRYCHGAVRKSVIDRCDDCWEDYAELTHWWCCDEAQEREWE